MNDSIFLVYDNNNKHINIKPIYKSTPSIVKYIPYDIIDGLCEFYEEAGKIGHLAISIGDGHYVFGDGYTSEIPESKRFHQMFFFKVRSYAPPVRKSSLFSTSCSFGNITVKTLDGATMKLFKHNFYNLKKLQYGYRGNEDGAFDFSDEVYDFINYNLRRNVEPSLNTIYSSNIVTGFGCTVCNPNASYKKAIDKELEERSTFRILQFAEETRKEDEERERAQQAEKQKIEDKQAALDIEEMFRI